VELYGGLPDIFVPRVYTELSTRKVNKQNTPLPIQPTLLPAGETHLCPLTTQVLTLEWVDGARLVNREQIRQYDADPARLVDTLVQCSLRQMLEVCVRKKEEEEEAIVSRCTKHGPHPF